MLGDWTCESLEQLLHTDLLVSAETAKDQHDIFEAFGCEHLFFHELEDCDRYAEQGLGTFQVE